MDDSHIFCNYEAIFPQSRGYLQHTFVLPMLSATLHTIVVKFLTSLPEHITKTLFQLFVISKMVSM
jgi:hypothetical protein